METNLHNINVSIQIALESSDKMKRNADKTDQAVSSSYEAVVSLQDQNRQISQSASHVRSFAADFDQVHTMIEQLLDYIEHLYAMMEAIQKGASGVTGEMQQISAVNEQDITAMEELAVMSDEQIESAKQVDHELS